MKKETKKDDKNILPKYVVCEGITESEFIKVDDTYLINPNFKNKYKLTQA